MALQQSTGRGSTHRVPGSGGFSGWAGNPQLTVLVADPDLDMLAGIQHVLSPDSVHALVCRDGAQALFLAGRWNPDVVLLSADLPKVDVADLIGIIKDNLDAAVVLGIGDGQVDAAGPALAAGASGLISRPYDARQVRELLEVQLARVQERLQHESVVRLGPLELDSPAFEVRCAGRPLELTLREFELLRFLMQHADRAVTREQIQSDVWGVRGEEVSYNTIAVHVGRLRERLAGAAKILSIRNVGYRLVLESADGEAVG